MSAVEGHSSKRDNLRLPACLIIMDGFGLSDPGPSNAISQAHTPHLDEVFASCSTMQLAASGEAVGLPEGQMGNSEVGHLNIGAGRVVYQELTRINRACADGSFAANPTLNAAFSAATQPGAALHLMGLLSDGGVHSTKEHLYALMHAAKAAGVRHIVVHCFMDGRDVSPKSGAGYLLELEAVASDLTCDDCLAQIGSMAGRYYAMDRDNRWDRVERAWHALALAEPFTEASPDQIISASYDAGITDEFVEPVAFSARGMRNGDAAVFFNFRPDRAREITRALVDSSFTGFERPSFPRVQFVCLTEYDPEIPAAVAYAKEFPAHVLADVLADAGLSQYHIAETEKYAHVTFFLNGGVEEPKVGERRVLVPSPKVATYDLQPEMSEPEVASTLANAIDAGESDVYLVNFANCDMVGHTGSVPAAVAAVEAVDAGVGQVLAALKRRRGCALITADHGNADKMLAEDGSPFTAHTTALVPLALVDYTGNGFILNGCQGSLCDLAPTLLAMIGLEAPVEMDGHSLLVD
ncbi:MAG: 2,3-bisphosphoglycerate-independent phosphoglycerate mutase [Gordonibacter sp.]|nr:2,3-bisphosphoglycerate-independent phosphoglycerate mutase [Gordonibacter sp.]